MIFVTYLELTIYTLKCIYLCCLAVVKQES